MGTGKKESYMVDVQVVGLDVEIGYFSLRELQSVRGSWGLPIERDLSFEPKSLRELKSLNKKMR